MNTKNDHGIVYLVGAGPGDPGLLTVRGRQLLETADVVVYDHLANPKLLDYCPRAEAIYVGKQAAKHTLSQQEINDLLVQKAREGRRVVRLKGGDPFVFGRGGEECLALRDAGLRFEIVPGVTSAIAAAAYAGIPVTHRDFNSSFTLVTGHEKDEENSNLPWDALAKLPCLAFYMGVAALPRIARRLMDAGMSPDTPAAAISWGTWPRQKCVVSDLARIHEATAGLPTPAITIIGKVVTLRDSLQWFENRPLFGQTFIVTRTRDQASALSQELEEYGAAVIEAPTIRIAPAEDIATVDAAILSAAKFDWIVFTSANGVAQTKTRLIAHNSDARVFGKAKIAAIGSATAQALRSELFLNVDVCPDSFVAEALAEELISRGEVQGRKFLLLRADIARPVLNQRLVQAGAAEVRDIGLYQTLPETELPPEAIDLISSGTPAWITFTSASTVRNFIQLLGTDYAAKLAHAKLASIGPITTEALREAKLEPTVQAKTFNVPGLVEAILEHK